ncbi:penicillin-binding protein 1A [Salinisphaera hydrothermalis]|uniref:Penicillin-binding protein 1A n=1 Tax=Salinisphaera hydrothermalis (strain C41B8) TaxID=1304275 RepID=A0A084IRC1_SALHC|nr:penicillin-binding protein 1A [Salinisphaera hydrothermalis]KEZ79255.1 penicillin-binding protein, 1A family [Salinisphaera hydrothermalis C41B8]
MKKRSRGVRVVIVLLAGLLSAITLAVCVVAGVYLYFGPQLPDAGDIGQTQFNEPLRVYTADHKLIGEYGTERRKPVTYDEIPKQQVDAFVAAEDDRFWEHPGVDYQGLMRAVIHLVTTGRKTQGGSTITMQLARNLYLSDAKTYTRKIKEMILALRLESKLTKKQIMELYLNKIYLGERAYGIGAAAQVYYNKPLDKLDLAQRAMLAGLPKAPSAFNPIVNPTRAKQRRDYVLRRMHALGFIDDAAWKQARNAPITAGEGSDQKNPARYEARYIAEMVRQDMVARYGDKAYTGGYSVVTTIRSKRQREADHALRKDLLAYDARHGWHGPEKTLDSSTMKDSKAVQDALDDMTTRGGLVPAVVLSTDGQTVHLQTGQYGKVSIGASQIPWLHGNKAASSLVSRGDVVRLAYTGAKDKDKQWTLAEIPKVQGALVAMDPHTGGIEALVGGFDFGLSKFNRAVQARRQPGSSFKPFLYSAALANGFTAATIVNDAPVVYQGSGLDDSWRPQNYSGTIHGPTRLREGLVHSLNLVSIRVLRRVGIGTAIDYISKFGLPANQMPHNLSLALGSATFSPLQMATAYSVLANEGYQVKPYYISKITNGRGKVVFQAKPKVACDEVSNCPALTDTSGADDTSRLAPHVIKSDNAYIVGDMMRDVIKHGTGRGALKLGRNDLSGKTGTTNHQIDAWFSGFNANLVTVTWVGFDKLKPMGHAETGAHAALPMWTDFMGAALSGQPEAIPPKPDDIETVQINPQTGQRALNGGGIPEIFRKGHAPTVEQARHSGKHDSSNEVQQLF